MQSISLASAEAPLVLAIDIGTSSVRALLFDAQARQIDSTESQTGWELTHTADDGLVADADALVDLVVHTIDVALNQIGARTSDIGAVGVTSFWHSMLALDERQRASGPLYMWIDNRSKTQAHELREDESLAARMRTETGCRPHSSYWPSKLHWLRGSQPQAARNVNKWVSFSDYLMLRLTGELSTSVCMASGTGLLDIRTCTWHVDIAREFGIDVSALPPLVDRTDPVAPLRSEFAVRWPSLATVPWYPALGDGAAANVGSGCVGSDRIALTIGTSAAMRVIVSSDDPAPSALWEYRLDRNQRVIGGALSNGGNVTRWIADLVAGGDMEQISSAAESILADGHGLTWLPFFAGERSPSWNDDAFASLLGMRFATTNAEIFRAALEGTAYRLAAVYDDLRSVAAPDHEIHANGGAALNSPLWMQIIADTFGHNLDAMDADAEVSARGAAVSALNVLGVWKSLRPGKIVSSLSIEPDAERHRKYQQARARQAAYETAVNRAQEQIMSN
jgi:gluconokinase